MRRTSEEARDLALKRFGSVTLAKERARDVDTLRWLADIDQDLRYALRQQRKTPAFAFVVILSLALGIGVNTAIFSLLDAMLLRTLPVAEPERLVRIHSASAGDRSSTWSYGIWDQIRQHAPMFDGAIACSSIERFNLADAGGETQHVPLSSGRRRPRRRAHGCVDRDADRRQHAHRCRQLAWRGAHDATLPGWAPERARDVGEPTSTLKRRRALSPCCPVASACLPS